MNNANLLDLQTHSFHRQIPRYLVVECRAQYKKNMQVLTPIVMRWSPNMWIMDIENCLRFWEVQADKQQVSMFDLLRRVLSKSFGSEFRAVCAPHPWPAVFLLNSMKEKKLRGLVNLQSSYGEVLYRDATWDAWFAPFKHLLEHLQAVGHGCETRRRQAHQTTSIDASRCRSRIAQMQRSLHRLDLATPHSLKQASSLDIRRRFGKILADVWQWTYDFDQQPTEGGLFAETLFGDEQVFSDGFPWVSWQAAPPTVVVRHLDEPLWQWDHMEGLIREDLDRLCSQKSLDPLLRLTELSWQLTLYNMETVTIPIRFRNPHSLHAEKGTHKTALYQILYNYESFAKSQAEKSLELNLPLEAPLVSWKFIVKHTLQLSDKINDLFADQAQCDAAKVLQIENKLPVPLQRYQMQPNFEPHAAFAPKNQAQHHNFSMTSWRVAGLQRPFFVKATPQSCPPPSKRQLYFLERTNTPWWQKSSTPSSFTSEAYGCHDYFMMMDGQQRRHWVYRDNRGQWYSHGFFD